MKKFATILCIVWWLVFVGTFAHAANCAWWENLDNIDPFLSEAIKFGYVVGAYSTMGDMHGSSYATVLNDVLLGNIKKFLATGESITVVVANIDIFCEEKRNFYVSIPLYLNILLKHESQIIKQEDARYEEKILRELLPVENPQTD